jgi:transposase
MSYYGGLDLHSTNTMIGVMGQNHERLFCKRCRNDLSIILAHLEPYKQNMVGVVVESTFNWYWLVDGLSEAGYTVHLAHPAAFSQYNGLKHADDKHSAFFLAKMLLLGILPEGHIFSVRDRHIRDLLRKRLRLVNNRTQYILSFKSLVNRNLSINLSSNAIKKLTEADIEQMFEDEHLLLSAQANISAMRYFNPRIKEIEKKILQTASVKPEFEILLTAPGIGPILALTISLETGDINRFKDVGKYASYCRSVSSQRTSNDKKKGENNRKNGNKYLAWAYLEAAHKLKRHCPQAEAFYKRKTIKTNKIVAIKALAHKLSRACYYMMKDNVAFDVNKIFGYPLKVKNRCGGKPDRGLDVKPLAPIGNTATPT